MPRAKSAVKPTTYYGTGRRKTAVARVYLRPGKGILEVNKLPLENYFAGRSVWQTMVRLPLLITDNLKKFDMKASVKGGGVSGQAGAVRHGIARALLHFDEQLRPVLKKEGLLTRDPREKERKKYGRKRARRGFQWTKR